MSETSSSPKKLGVVIFSVFIVIVFLFFIALALLVSDFGKETTGGATRLVNDRESNSWTATLYGSMTPLRMSQHGTLVYLYPERAHPPAHQPIVAWDTVTQQPTIVCPGSGFVPRMVRSSSRDDEFLGSCVREQAP